MGEIANDIKLSFKSTSRHLSILSSADLLEKELKDLLEKLIELVGQRTSVIKLRELQNQLKSPENLLEKIEKRIHNPNPLIEKLGI